VEVFGVDHHPHLPVRHGANDADTDLLESIVRLLRLLDCPRDLSCAWSDGGP
jgi:hypothetical protein